MKDIFTNIYTHIYNTALDTVSTSKSVQGNEEELYLANRIKRLNGLGFRSSKERAALDGVKLEKSKEPVLRQQEDYNMAHRVLHFRRNYPDKMFIPDRILLEICSKNKLQVVTPKNYVGFVPDDSLSEIESFKFLDKNDIVFQIHPDITTTWASRRLTGSDLSEEGLEYFLGTSLKYLVSDIEDDGENYLLSSKYDRIFNLYVNASFPYLGHCRAYLVTGRLQICITNDKPDPSSIALITMDGGSLVYSFW